MTDQRVREIKAKAIIMRDSPVTIASIDPNDILQIIAERDALLRFAQTTLAQEEIFGIEVLNVKSVLSYAKEVAEEVTQ